MAAKAAIHGIGPTCSASGILSVATVTNFVRLTMQLRLVVDGRLRGHDEEKGKARQGRAFPAGSSPQLPFRHMRLACLPTVSTGLPSTFVTGSMPRPGLSEAVMRPSTRFGAPSAIVTVP